MPSLEPFLIGAFSGAFSTSVLQPLDVIKTRIQIIDENVVKRENKNQTFERSTKFTSVIKNVIHNEGVTGLWRGLCPSLFRTVPGVGVYFGSLHWINNAFCSEKPSPYQSLLTGMLSRTIAGVTTMPFSMLKTRYESGIFSYNSMFKALGTIYRQEGLSGTFRGLFATMCRDVPYSGIYLMFYSFFKNHFIEESSFRPTSTSLYLSCGVFAGFMSSVLTHPPDVIKTRVQTFPETCSTYYKAIRHIVQNNGFQGFFRGLTPRLIKKTLTSSFSWTAFEKMMELLHKR